MSEETRILLVNNLKPEDYMIITDNFRKLDKEIERLKDLNTMIRKELQQKENIIKEIREYIEENTGSYYTNIEETNEEFELTCDPKELLEILDKGETKSNQ